MPISLSSPPGWCDYVDSPEDHHDTDHHHQHHHHHGEDSINNIAHQYHAQESMSGIDPSKQKFQYVLAAPTSVATKLSEDTMTYLNQGQAYEIKLENITDVAEGKKGFMCSIVNIGFQEHHMQQAENELWHQWSHQHANERIFSVDMKLSYNVFGVEWDGLNKYEFLWDSSKAARVFIRINSISTEFTPKKHGGEKGVPFKLSIETFSYNSKTHDSYFISAACCQIKVFKPKGAERKIRSDRDKIFKRAPSEQEKYHRSCDHTSFRECSLNSLHPMADGSLLSYYRHSHGQFASKQVDATSAGATPAVQAHQSTANHQQPNEHLNQTTNGTSQNNGSSTGDKDQGSDDGRGAGQQQQQQQQQVDDNDRDSDNGGPSGSHRRGQYGSHSGRATNNHTEHMDDRAHTDFSAPRLFQNNNNHYNRDTMDEDEQHQQNDQDYGSSPHPSHGIASELNFNQHANDNTPQPNNALNQMYHNNPVRQVASGNTQHFNMPYYGHTLSSPHVPSHVPPPGSYPPITSAARNNSLTPNFGVVPQQHSFKAAVPFYKHFNDKSVSSAQSTYGTPFRASSLSISSHNNFQPHFGALSDPCGDVPQAQDGKDSHSVINGGYHHTDNGNYESYSPNNHKTHSNNNSQQQQQPWRQRSASTLLATPPLAHCASYMNHSSHSQSRHIDNYLNTPHSVDNQLQSNPFNTWPHSGQSSVSTNSNCASRGCSSGNCQEVSPYASGNEDHYPGMVHHCGSEQNSPQKSTPQHANDSPSGCYSKQRSNQGPNSGGSDYNRQHDHPMDTKPNTFSRVTVNSNCSEVASWFVDNRFGIFLKTFSNFSGSDLLSLSRSELIEICGLLDGIRLYNSLHNQPVKPRRVLYICHKGSEIFFPVYLYDVTLKELLKEISNIILNDHFYRDGHSLEPKFKKSPGDKSTINSSSSTDSISALSTETGIEESYAQGSGGDAHHFFNEINSQRQQDARHTLDHKSTNNSANNISHHTCIDRLLVDGLTTVKIVATDQVVQLLEDGSVWTLGVTNEESGLTEACISACRSKRTSK